MTDQPQAMRDSAHLEAAAAPTTPTTPAKSSGFLPSVPRKIFWLWIALGIILVAAVVGTVLGVVLSKTNSIKPVQLQDHPIDSDDPTISIENIGDFHALSQFANLTAMKVIRDDPRFETNNKSRVFVVGDVHGSLPELNALVEKLEYDYDAGDRLILAGDLVDKGPDSIGVIRRAKQLKAWCVRGNHDDKVVRLATYHRQGAGFGGTGDANIPEGAVHDPLANDNHHIAIASNMTDDDYDYLASCPMILAVPAIESLFVHAGVHPNRPLDKQEPFFIMNMRSLTATGDPVKKSDEGEYPWSDVWNSVQGNNTSKDAAQSTATSPYRKVYYGHAASRGLELKNYTFGVDTGCVYGGKLTALEIKTGELTQVPCKMYYDDSK